MKKIVISIVLILVVLTSAYFAFLFYLGAVKEIPDFQEDYKSICNKTYGDILTPYEYKGYLMESPTRIVIADSPSYYYKMYLHPENESEKFKQYNDQLSAINKKSKIIDALHETKIFPTERLIEQNLGTSDYIISKMEENFDKAYICMKEDEYKNYHKDSLYTFNMIYVDDLKASIIVTKPDTTIPELKYYSFIFKDIFTTEGYAFNFEIDSAGVHEVIRFKIYNNEDDLNEEMIMRTQEMNLVTFTKLYSNNPMYCEYYSKDQDVFLEKVRKALALKKGLNIKATGSFNFSRKINDIFDVEFIE